MTKKGFSDNEALKFGWQKAGENWLFFFAYLGIVVVLSLVNGFINTVLMAGVDINHPASLFVNTSVTIVSILFFIISFILGMGLISASNKIYDGKKPDVQDLFNQSKKFFPYLFVSILYFLITIIGFFLLVIPGIYWSIKYRFAPYLVITEGMSPVEALIQSGEMTAGVKWDLLGYSAVAFLVMLIGLCIFFIGILPASIIVILANIYVYRQLLD